MDIRKLLGQNIRKQRLIAKISQEELAVRVNADQAYVSRVEAGQLNVTIDTVDLFAIALAVTPRDLFEP